MGEYVELKNFWNTLDIEEGDIVFISSDIKMVLFQAMEHNEEMDVNVLIDALVQKVGENGTILFPTYNWDFCRGVAFDYYKTPCMTGTLGSIALKRADFKRTKHPIYSFAVYGKYQKLLCEMENISSFGADSPFAFLKEMNAKNYVIDVSLKRSFTFTHFAEEQSGKVEYRYLKNFSADYIDETGKLDTRTYAMFVRDLDLNVQATIDPIEEDFLRLGAEKKYTVNNSEIKLIYMKKAYEIMLQDILENKARKLCIYNGQ